MKIGLRASITSIRDGVSLPQRQLNKMRAFSSPSLIHSSCILGTGSYLPEKVISNEDIVRDFDISPYTPSFIDQQTGILRRRRAASTECSSDLGVHSALAAIDDAGLKTSDIDMIILNTITPDYADPGTGCFLQEKLGLVDIPCYDIRQQCTGLIYALTMADSFVKTGFSRHPLIVCPEVLSKRFDPSSDGKNVAILVGDGAGAVVVGAASEGRRIVSTHIHADGRGIPVFYTKSPGTASESYLSHEDLNCGNIHFRMNGKEMFKMGVEGFCKAIKECLEYNSLTLDEIDWIVPHQPNLRMMEAVAQQMQIPEHKIYINVYEYGNMGSACMPVALDEVLKEGLIGRGGRIMLVAFGSGFVWASALLVV